MRLAHGTICPSRLLSNGSLNLVRLAANSCRSALEVPSRLLICHRSFCSYSARRHEGRILASACFEAPYIPKPATGKSGICRGARRSCQEARVMFWSILGKEHAEGRRWRQDGGSPAAAQRKARLQTHPATQGAAGSSKAFKGEAS